VNFHGLQLKICQGTPPYSSLAPRLLENLRWRWNARTDLAAQLLMQMHCRFLKTGAFSPRNLMWRSIIVGGTGLYFTALTQGLAEIPATPPNIRAEADAIVADVGFEALIAEIDELTQSSIDLMNPMRVQRAWEVQRVTGKGIRAWQDETPAPLLSLTNSVPILFDVEKDWLNARIAQRFDTMLDTGALEEAQKNLENWDPALLSNRAIGAPELVAHLQGKMTLEDAREAATIATRQFAKRQRTWFRSKMKDWLHYRPAAATK
jgi:tRNA dimethylallyltransferase